MNKIQYRQDQRRKYLKKYIAKHKKSWLKACFSFYPANASVLASEAELKAMDEVI